MPKIQVNAISKNAEKISKQNDKIEIGFKNMSLAIGQLSNLQHSIPGIFVELLCKFTLIIYKIKFQLHIW